MSTQERALDFVHDQVKRAPFTGFLLFGLWLMHGENKELQARCESYLAKTTEALALVEKSVESNTKLIDRAERTADGMTTELRIHREARKTASRE